MYLGSLFTLFLLYFHAAAFNGYRLEYWFVVINYAELFVVCAVCAYVDSFYLSYVYMLEFVLDDGSGWLSAGLWKEEAVS